LRGIPFTAHPSLQITYKDRILDQKYVPDFVVYEQISFELKAIKSIGPNEEAQLLNYLKTSGLRVGVLLNFGAERRLEEIQKGRHWRPFLLFYGVLIGYRSIIPQVASDVPQALE
jgi:GxxExxY protein